MLLSNKKIVRSVNVLGDLVQKQLPIKASYIIAKNVSKIEAELNIYNKQKQKLVDKYSEKDQNGKNLVEGGNVKIQIDHIADWNNDITELLEMENEIDIHKIKIDDLLSSNCSFTPSELIQIEYMLEGEI